MNDRWRDEIVWKRTACLRRRSGVMNRDQAVYLSLPSLSSSVFSCSHGRSAGICLNMQVLTSAARPGFYFACKISALAQTFLQGWRSYLRTCKDEWTYLLEQKCPNRMCLKHHKSATVNLEETKLPTSRIYLFHASGQIKAAQWCHSPQGVHIFFFSLAEYSKRSWGRHEKFVLRNISAVWLFPVACERSVFSFI